MRQDEHTLAGAYALNALPESERHRFEQHLAHCDSCLEEVRGLTETTALLGDAVARTPPERLRGRVLDAVSRTRQLAPEPLRPIPPRPRFWQGWNGLMLAACLAVILALGGLAVFQQDRIADLREDEQAIAAVLAAPDAEAVSGQPAEDVSATVVSSREEGALVFTAQGLERRADEDYQLWLSAPDGSVRSAGLLSVGANESAEPLLASDIGDSEGIAVTVEPEGGSEQPTTEPMMAMPLEES